MKLNFLGIVDILFPKTEDERILAACTDEFFLSKYHHTYIYDVLALSSFNDSTVRSALHLNKFHAQHKAGTLLSLLLKKWFLELDGGVSYLVIPVPLSQKRQRERGYNQVSLVARIAVQDFPHITLAENILKKHKHTVPQTSLSKEKRKHNLTGVYSLNTHKSESLRGAHIILLDDVTTTGATLQEAKATLLPHSPASITCVALAH